VTSRPDEFDFEATVRSVGETLKKASAEEQGPLRLALDALYFLFAENRLHEFRDYVHKAGLPAEQVFRIEREFPDMAQASTWLTAQPAPEHGTLVSVAGRTHTVWREKDGSLLLLPSFTPQELEARRK
jgi:hypothetical protein